MSSKLPAMTAERMIAIPKDHGFKVARQSGSHVVLKHVDGHRATIPMHKGRDLGKGLLHQIMADAGLTADNLRR